MAEESEKARDHVLGATRSGELASGELVTTERLAGRYQVLGLLGVGGMGSVYRAHDAELDETVALKVLRKELVSSEAMLARFRQEVKLARRVTHRNVARTFDIGEHGGEKFLTMEYVEGESLSAAVGRRGAFPIADAVHIAAEICAGLAAAHAAGVVHRDLKPENVLLAKDGRVVITDFGIARVVEPDASSHATVGVVTGTPAYMAPEQVEGGTIDARVDIYAMGEILFEMLTGTVAWSGDSLVQVAAARLHKPPPDPRLRRADMPDSLVAIITRAMAKRPEDRFGSAAELAQALAGLTLPASALSPPAAPSSVVIRQAPTASSQTSPRTSGPAASAGVPTEAGSDKTLAVLLFKNGGPPDDAYLAEGLTEDLIDSLSIVPGVKVRAFGAVHAFRGQTEDPRVVGEKLDVQVVVEGSVRRIGDMMRVTARIVSVSDGFQLWARRFDKAVAAFLEVADEIANAIAEALTVDRKPPPNREAPTDPVALELYLRARHEVKFSNREATQRALALFAEALKRAPADPIILSGYAMAQVREVLFGDNSDATERVARGIVEEAVRLAPNQAEPHLALAMLERSLGGIETVAKALNRALSLGRPSADALDLLGQILIECGPLELAIQKWEQALALEPRLYATRADLGRAYDLVGNYKRRMEIVDAAPTEALDATGFWAARVRGMMWRGQHEAVSELYARTGADQLNGPARIMMHAYLKKEIPANAMREMDQRMSVGSRAKRRTAFFGELKAEFLAHIGLVEEAMETIAIVDEAQSFDTTWFQRCPFLDPLRHDPRFQEFSANAAERARRMRAALGV